MRQVSTVKRATVKTSAANNRVEAPLPKTTSTNGDFSEKVAKKAYELYVARGCQNGHDVEDWAKAEKLVKAEYKIA